MALQTINPTPLARTDQFIVSTTPSGQVMNASNNGVAAMFLAPKDGNISKIGRFWSSITSPPAYRFGIEGTTTTRQPNGTIKGSGTAKVDETPAGTGWSWLTLDSPLAVTMGQSLAATVRYLSGTVGAGNTGTINYRHNLIVSIVQNYASVLTGGTWTANVGPTILAVQYDDGYVPPGMLPYTAFAANTISNASSPKHRGTKWTPVFGCRVIGAIVCVRPASGSDFKINLFSGTNGTAVASTPVAANVDWGSTGSQLPGFVPLAPTILTPGTDYRFTLEPTTATAITSLVSVTTPDTDSRKAYVGDLSGTTAVTPGTWTDAPNDFYPIVPVIDQIDVAVSISGGGPLIGPGRLVRN